MKVNFLRIAFITVLTLLFVGCGSSSGGNSNSDYTETKYSGILIDSVVQGVRYECGTDTTSNYTDADGRFECSSVPIQFYIGNIKLGEISVIPTDDKVYIQDIVGVDRNNTTDPILIKIAQLLQSLDDDGDVSERIVISRTRNDLFTDMEVIDISDFDLNELVIKDPTITLVTPEEAIAHLLLTISGRTTDETTDGTANNVNLNTVAVDNILHPVVITKNGYTIEVLTNGTIPIEPSKSTLALFGHIKTMSDYVVLEINDSYAFGTQFQIVVKDTNGNIVGESVIVKHAKVNDADIGINYGTIK